MHSLARIARNQVLKRQVIQSQLKLSHKSKRDLLFQQQALSQGVSHQFSATGAWAGVILSTTAQVADPFKVQLNGETCMGRWLWRMHPFPRQRSTPKTLSNFQSNGGRDDQGGMCSWAPVP